MGGSDFLTAPSSDVTTGAAAGLAAGVAVIGKGALVAIAPGL
jgi:hypothetical protein